MQFYEVRSALKFLYVQRVTGLSPPGDRPLFDRKGVQRFERELSSASTYLEFGAGGSTVLADTMGVPTVSVESDRFYAKIVQSRLTSGCVRLLTPRMGLTGEWGSPFISSVAKGLRYVDAPFPLSPFPDFILVDGRYRVACALECARRAQLAASPATWMMDDYTDRPWFHGIENHLGSPEIVGRTALFMLGAKPISRHDVEAAVADKR
jgi:hypothetical protein